MKAGEALLFAGVCGLIVVVVGTVYSGRVLGADYTGGIPIPGLHLQVAYTATEETVGTATAGSAPGGTSGTTPASGQGSFPFLQLPAIPSIPVWVFIVAAFALLAGASLYVLKARQVVSVVDLAETADEMQYEQRRMADAGSWKRRNAALLRYYVLMRRACTAFGIPEDRGDTPQEYIGRVAGVLGMAASDGAVFAEAVNRARFGEELSAEETAAAVRVMEGFTGGVRRRVGLA